MILSMKFKIQSSKLMPLKSKKSKKNEKMKEYLVLPFLNYLMGGSINGLMMVTEMSAN